MQIITKRQAFLVTIAQVLGSDRSLIRLFFDSYPLALESSTYHSFFDHLQYFCSQINNCVYSQERLSELSTIVGAYKPSSASHAHHVFWPNKPKYPDQDIYSVTPYTNPQYIINKKSKISSFGSCFANEIGLKLLELGYNYFYAQPELPRGVFDNLQRSKYPNFSAYYGILFNTLSLDYLVRRASFDTNLPKILLKWDDTVNSSLYVDPFREGLVFSSPAAYNDEYLIHSEALHRTLSHSDIIIWTFGLGEAWVFSEHLNLAISHGYQSFLKPFLSQKILTIDDHIQAFAKFYKFVKSINSNCHFIISCSPIPLSATYQADSKHVVVANLLSKSQIICACHELAAQFTDVSYFPAFDYVYNNLKDPWADDQRHVKPDTVDRIVAMFLQMYSSDDSL